MKGLKIEKAKPSNVIDIYALLQEAVKEGCLVGKPTERQMKSYYFVGLLNEVDHPNHIWFVAKRGRGYLGFVHAVLIPGRWDGQVRSVAVDTVFVTKRRRKNGIGRKLLDEVKKEVQNLEIKRVEFVTPIDQVEMWTKKYSAKTESYIMGVDL